MKFFVLLRVCNCEIKRLIHEKVKVYGQQDTGNLSPKKQDRADVFFIIEVLKKL